MYAEFSARRRGKAWLALPVSMMLAFAVPAAAQAATVNVTSGGADSGTCGVGANPPCATVAQGVANASANDTVEVGPGTFTGSAQLVIDKNLTLSGAGAGQTTFSPGFDTPTFQDSWIQVNTGNTFNVNQIAIDGNHNGGDDVSFGIRYVGSAGGAIDSVAFRDIAWSSIYRGMAVSTNVNGAPAAASGDLDITNSTFEDIQRVGVLYKGTGVTGTFANNTYTGKGDGDFLDYALDISAGADVEVIGNTVSDNTGVASSDGSGSAGFLVSTFWGAGTEATFTGNTVTDNSTGIHVGFDGADTSAVDAGSNRIVGNETGVVSSAPAVDAENNWWGCNGGPGSTGCDTVDGTVDSDPHVVLELSASPTSIETGGATSELTAAFVGSDGSEPVLPFDGLPVGWTTDLGSVAATSNIADEEANNTFTSGATAGTANISASFDNATDGAQVAVVAPTPAPDPGGNGGDGGGDTPLPGPGPVDPNIPTDTADDVVGTTGDDVIDGLGGDDEILGGLGDDILNGGDGNDSLVGGKGDDKVNGGAGKDEIDGGKGDDVIRGGDGNDVLDGGDGNDDVGGGKGKDNITANDGEKDEVNCGSGTDTVNADGKDKVDSNCEKVK